MSGTPGSCLDNNARITYVSSSLFDKGDGQREEGADNHGSGRLPTASDRLRIDGVSFALQILCNTLYINIIINNTWQFRRRPETRQNIGKTA